MVGRVGLS